MRGHIPEDRRVKFLIIPEYIILLALRHIPLGEIVQWPDPQPLPEDYQSLGVQYIWEAQNWAMLIWSSTFDSVTDGENIPRIYLDVSRQVWRVKSLTETHERIG